MKKQLKIGTWNLCNGLAMKMDFVKFALKKYKLDIFFLQETEISQDYDLRLLEVQGYRLETEQKSAKEKIRLVCYIHEALSYKRTLEEENTHYFVKTRQWLCI